MIVQQQTVLRHHDHHPRRFHFIELADRSRQLALDGSHVICPLHEIRDAKVRLVKNLEPDAIAMRQALRGQLHSHQVDLVSRHVNRPAGLTGLVGDFHLIQHRDDFRGLGVVQLSVKKGKINPAGPKSQTAQRNRHHPGGQHNTDALVQAQLLPDGQELAGKQSQIAIHELDLHPHQFLVRLQELVAHLHHQLK